MLVSFVMPYGPRLLLTEVQETLRRSVDMHGQAVLDERQLRGSLIEQGYVVQ